MQDETEFAWLVSRLQHITSLLEIGSRAGGSLRGFVNGCPNLKKVRSIDIEPTAALRDYITELEIIRKIDSDLFEGDSQSLESIFWARDNGPYDFIFIDGDHEAGVFLDWDNYRSMAPLIGFHDIAHSGHQVCVLWGQIVQSGYQTEQCVNSYMGTGIVKTERV